MWNGCWERRNFSKGAIIRNRPPLEGAEQDPAQDQSTEESVDGARRPTDEDHRGGGIGAKGHEDQGESGQEPVHRQDDTAGQKVGGSGDSPATNGPDQDRVDGKTDQVLSQQDLVAGPGPRQGDRKDAHAQAETRTGGQYDTE